jgi:N utilization substance protein B
MAERLARGAQSEVETLDAAIAAALTNWPFDRLAAVDRNIMRIAAYELAREPQTPAAVVIDEAVEMARRFGEKDSPAFVNGVLDAVKRALREDGAARARPRGGEKP